MQFIIVTGMSGAGKSSVLKFLEDLGFFCADNLPPSLMLKFAEVCFRTGSGIDRVGLGVDIRGGKLFDDLAAALNELDNSNFTYDILFLDASDETLVNRYKETRRSHPLAKNDRVITGILKEREMIEHLKQKATHIIDTSNVLTRQLKEIISEIFVDCKSFDSLMITVLSFGFKYGVPSDSDLVFDVRFIKNPFYEPLLKPLSGLDSPVSEYVLNFDQSKIFIDKATDMLEFLIPNYISEGKNQLVISIGCTGGRHRSVTIASEIYKLLQNNGNSVILKHRDIDKYSKVIT